MLDRLSECFPAEQDLRSFIRGYPDRVELPFPELANYQPEDVLMELCAHDSLAVKQLALSHLRFYCSPKVRTFLISYVESDLDTETRWFAFNSCYEGMAIAEDIPMLIAVAENSTEDSDFRTTAYLAISDMARGHQRRAKEAAAAYRRLNKNRELYEALHEIAQHSHPTFGEKQP